MATVKYYAAMYSDMALPSNAGRLLDHDDTFAELTTATSDTFVLMGQGFTYVDDALTSGAVSEVVFKASGSSAYRITDINWDIAANEGAPSLVKGSADLFGGNDTVIGSRVQDYLYAGAGKDTIRAGRGDDNIRGGEGNDILKGGAGSDSFIFELGDGKDRILDFDTHGPIQDVIVMNNPGALKNIEIYERFNNVFIEYGKGDTIILKNVDLDDLSHKNFSSMRHFDFDFG